MEAAFGIFLASLVGSPHCAAMCGPFLAFAAAGPSGDARPRQPMVTRGYHAGRLIAYLLLGLLAGTLGAGVGRLGVLVGMSRMAAVVAGVLMVAWGLDTLLAWRGVRSRLHAPRAMQRALGRAMHRIAAMPGGTRALVTGLATALLPCGWLYAFVAAAGGTGSPLQAALVMVLFWSGTLPVMVTVGLGLQRLAGPARRALPLVTASVVVVIGLLTISGRLRPMLVPVPHPSAQVHADHR